MEGQGQINVVPQGANLLDVINGTVEPEKATVVPEGGTPPAPPATPPATPPSGEPPVVVPPVTPAAGNPPVVVPPAVTPPSAQITEEQAIQALFGADAPFKTKADIDTVIQVAAERGNQITPFLTVLNQVKEQAMDPEIVALANFKKVTGHSNLSIRSLVENAVKPESNALDVLVADTILTIPGRASRVEETRDELARRYNIAEGQSLTLEAEQAIQNARTRLGETWNKVTALPVSPVDVDAQLQAANESITKSKSAWVTALETGIDNIVQAHPQVELFTGFSTQIDLTPMKQRIEEMADIAVSRGMALSQQTATKLIGDAYNSVIASNLNKICEDYYVDRKKKEDAAADNPLPVGRNPDTPPAAGASEYEKVRNHIMS